MWGTAGPNERKRNNMEEMCEQYFARQCLARR
jgi:hypothetical protein